MRALPFFLFMLTIGCTSTPSPVPSESTPPKPAQVVGDVVEYDAQSISSQAAFEQTFKAWKGLYMQNKGSTTITHDNLPNMKGGVMFTALHLDVEQVEDPESLAKETLEFESYQDRLSIRDLLDPTAHKLPGYVGVLGKGAVERQRNWDAVSSPSFGFNISDEEINTKMKLIFESLKGRAVFAYDGHSDHTGAYCVFGAPRELTTSVPLAQRSIDQLWVVICHSNPRL